MISDNIFDGIPPGLKHELFTSIHRGKSIRIERIVSSLGHCSPRDFWYDQDENEWIIVLDGDAAIQFEGEAKIVELDAGSYLNIPAHVKHRVLRTNSTRQTVWLAVFYGD
jgi:cupin 2 domain-containing protein